MTHRITSKTAEKFIAKSIKKFYKRKYISGRTEKSDRKLLKTSPLQFNKKAIRVAFEEARDKGYKVPALRSLI